MNTCDTHAYQRTSLIVQFTPVLALYDPFGVDVPLNLDITHSLIRTVLFARRGVPIRGKLLVHVYNFICPSLGHSIQWRHKSWDKVPWVHFIFPLTKGYLFNVDRCLAGQLSLLEGGHRILLWKKNCLRTGHITYCKETVYHSFRFNQTLKCSLYQDGSSSHSAVALMKSISMGYCLGSQFSTCCLQLFGGYRAAIPGASRVWDLADPSEASGSQHLPWWQRLVVEPGHERAAPAKWWSCIMWGEDRQYTCYCLLHSGPAWLGHELWTPGNGRN